MYELSYSLHIVGVALWIGAFIVVGLLLRSLAKSEEELKKHSLVIEKLRRMINWVVLPSGIVVMLTGVYMILQFNRDTLPLYLKLMEEIGGVAILLTVIVVSLYSKKLKKKLQGIELKKDKSLTAITKMYTNFLFISTILSIVVVVIVAMRLA
ncbi:MULTISPECIES: hypothetical protein [Alkalibacillus]|uniref:Copper resistance protein D domain-containing protein n=2 Tax=Alkalibacillus TaxID=331654 RepID=A0A511W0D3_9BACI|nr:hypothetical protein [Alkalibacillus haloalkaliphilus]MDV2581472.1 hypothetical protein [Alkalibacillus haloalkaliphilus]GEN44550.1 hypothetical protein AHA02nite_03260 [Alkalibacillus haloalkaliphilus]